MLGSVFGCVQILSDLLLRILVGDAIIVCCVLGVNIFLVKGGTGVTVSLLLLLVVVAACGIKTVVSLLLQLLKVGEGCWRLLLGSCGVGSESLVEVLKIIQHS